MGRTVTPDIDPKLRNELKRLWDEIEKLSSSVQELTTPTLTEPEVYTLSALTEDTTDNPINPGEAWPPVPTGMSAATGLDEETRNKQDTYLEFSWDNKGAGIRYILAFRKTSVTKWKEAPVEGSETEATISYREGGLKHNTEFTWKVKSVTDDGEESEYCADQTKTTQGLTATTIPVISEVKIKGLNLWIRFERIASANFDKFEIFAALTTGFIPDEDTFTNLIGRTENVHFKYTLPSNWIDQNIFVVARSCGKDGTFSDFCAEEQSSWSDLDAPVVTEEATVNLYHKKKDTFAEVTFAWLAVTDPHGGKVKYELWYWIQDVPGTPNKEKKEFTKDISITVPGMEDETIYEWKVRAIDKDEKEGAWSEVQDVNTGLDTVAPAKPEGFKVVAHKGSFNAKWNLNSEKDVEKYEIFVWTLLEEANAILLAVVSHPSNKKTFSLGVKSDNETLTLTASTNYYFWIRAKDRSGNASGLQVAAEMPVSVGDTKEVDLVAPDPPTNVTLTLTPQTGGKKDLAKWVVKWDWAP